MSKGISYATELVTTHDERTGALLRQWTSHPSIHHHPFFYVPAYSSDGTQIIFVSHRSDRPELYAVERGSGEIIQLTEREGISEWSLHPGWNNRFLLYIAGQTGYRIDLDNLDEQVVADFSQAAGMREKGMVGGAMGVTALSHCDRYWAVRVNIGDEAGLSITDLETGRSEIVLQRDQIGHLSFCPDDSNLLFAARTLQDRVWIVRPDGSDHRRLYGRKPGEWITHEVWLPGTRELAFVNWPHGIDAVHADTGALRRVARFNAWHSAPNRQGTLMVADTNYPDIGIQLFDLHDITAEPRTLCYPGASNMGTHWSGPFPYDNGPIEVYAPQHTHPHPSFSPDSRHVVFTSDRSGYAQIYEVEV
jgi:oligogalacturonide lyase